MLTPGSPGETRFHRCTDGRRLITRPWYTLGPKACAGLCRATPMGRCNPSHPCLA